MFCFLGSYSRKYRLYFNGSNLEKEEIALDLVGTSSEEMGRVPGSSLRLADSSYLRSPYPLSGQCIGDIHYCHNGFSSSLWTFIKPLNGIGTVMSVWNAVRGFAVTYMQTSLRDVEVNVIFRNESVETSMSFAYKTYRWAHIVFAYDNGDNATLPSTEIWLNGRNISHTTITTTIVGGDVNDDVYLVIGANGESDPPMDISEAILDDLVFTETPLSSGEIEELFGWYN